MPKTSDETKRYGPNNRTRDERVKPKGRKKWFGRVAMRKLAKVLERFDETVETLEIREQISAEKRDRPRRSRLKAIRERVAASAAALEARRERAMSRRRGSDGRFQSKRQGPHKNEVT